MTASSSVMLANLAYLIGAVVLAVIGGVAVWWRHRKPTSVHANMASFHRGLRALAPDDADRTATHTGPRIVEPPDDARRAVTASRRPAAPDSYGPDSYSPDQYGGDHG